MNKIFRNITTALFLAASVAGATAADILSVRDTITDPHIVYPASFEADTHLMMQNWYMQNYTELARGDYGSGPAVEPTDEELIQRLMSMPTVIEMPFNSVVKSYIKMYVDRRRSLVENMLGMSTYYMPIFEQALEQEGVPMELKYLPIIESALNPNAVSPAGATGLWQFMLPTARGLGMEINSLVDERRDPIRSSQMAARYLKQ
ncbi:MAG: transglycosylase SLT domain-containing protein, partial [Muribaculaceae bacterium]|nr:transglycosylase SLT domain-containing protein [Muribaculaceae bacterium]